MILIFFLLFTNKLCNYALGTMKEGTHYKSDREPLIRMYALEGFRV